MINSNKIYIDIGILLNNSVWHPLRDSVYDSMTTAIWNGIVKQHSVFYPFEMSTFDCITLHMKKYSFEQAKKLSPKKKKVLVISDDLM